MRPSHVRMFEHDLLGQNRHFSGEVSPGNIRFPRWAGETATVPPPYAAAFAEVQEQLHAGNTYEVNLTFRVLTASDTDPVTAYLRLRELNPAARSMDELYQTGQPHADVYEGLVEAMLEPVRAGRETCVITYGNPAVFDHSSHEAIRRAREEGYPARMLPAISSLDCLFVDLALDPGEDGLQCYDADRFLTRGTEPDVTVPLVLWQISVVGETVTTSTVNRAGLQRLADRLTELYGGDHRVTIYEATPFPVGRPSIETCSVAELPDAGVGGLSTLFVPPRP